MLHVRYEDSSLVIVDKPPGMHTAPLSDGEGGTLMELVLDAFPEVRALPGLKPLEPGLLHRLDRETSGLVVVARTGAAFAELRRSFAAAEARKDYLAACAPTMQTRGADTFRIESRFAPYGRGGKMVRAVLPGERSKKLVERAGAEVYLTEARVRARSGPWALLEASIRKGFRHQVRAHLAFLGFPILGDPLYGAPAPAGAPPRMYLHAQRIELPHPDTGRLLTVESPAPAEFTALLRTGKGEGQ